MGLVFFKNIQHKNFPKLYVQNPYMDPMGMIDVKWCSLCGPIFAQICPTCCRMSMTFATPRRGVIANPPIFRFLDTKKNEAVFEAGDTSSKPSCLISMLPSPSWPAWNQQKWWELISRKLLFQGPCYGKPWEVDLKRSQESPALSLLDNVMKVKISDFHMFPNFSYHIYNPQKLKDWLSECILCETKVVISQSSSKGTNKNYIFIYSKQPQTIVSCVWTSQKNSWNKTMVLVPSTRLKKMNDGQK